MAALVIALRDPEYRSLAIAVTLLLAVGTVFYHRFEDWGWVATFVQLMIKKREKRFFGPTPRSTKPDREDKG